MYLVADGQVLLVARDAPLHEVGEHVELAYSLDALVDDLLGARYELLVPEREHRLVGAPLADALQERVALADDAVELDELVVVGRACLRDLAV